MLHFNAPSLIELRIAYKTLKVGSNLLRVRKHNTATNAVAAMGGSCRGIPRNTDRAMIVVHMNANAIAQPINIAL